MKLTQERLKEVLDYNPETGIFTWKISKGRKGVGHIAGNLKHTGYMQIRINKIDYQAHRLAWLYMEGYWPENEVDHIDRNPSNNKWGNLRETSRACNSRNRSISKNNTSGINGVSWYANDKLWVSQIKINYKRIYLGSFKNKIDAAKARWEAEKKYDFPNYCTESSAYLYIKEYEKRD